MVCIFIAVFSVIVDRSVPAFCSELLYTCAALLGIDSVAGAFYKNSNSNNRNSNYKYDNFKSEDEYDDSTANDDKEDY